MRNNSWWTISRMSKNNRELCPKRNEASGIGGWKLPCWSQIRSNWHKVKSGINMENSNLHIVCLLTKHWAANTSIEQACILYNYHAQTLTKVSQTWWWSIWSRPRDCDIKNSISMKCMLVFFYKSFLFVPGRSPQQIKQNRRSIGYILISGATYMQHWLQKLTAMTNWQGISRIV